MRPRTFDRFEVKALVVRAAHQLGGLTRDDIPPESMHVYAPIIEELVVEGILREYVGSSGTYYLLM